MHTHMVCQLLAVVMLIKGIINSRTDQHTLRSQHAAAYMLK
jgi:hypothetical protein